MSSLFSPLQLSLFVLHLSVSAAEHLIFYDTIVNDTNFEYSSSYVEFVSGDSECREDNKCAKVTPSATTSYLQTSSGAVSTVGFSNIQITLKLSVTNWVSGCELTTYWTPDASLSSPSIFIIEEYTQSENLLTGNQLLTLSYDLSSNNNMTENNIYFAFGLRAYYGGNSFPMIYVDSISISGTVTNVTTEPPTSSPSIEPSNSPTPSPTIVVTMSTVELSTHTLDHGEASSTTFSTDAPTSVESLNQSPQNNTGLYASIVCVLSLFICILSCWIMYRYRTIGRLTRGSSEGRVSPGRKVSENNSMNRIRLQSESVVDDDASSGTLGKKKKRRLRVHTEGTIAASGDNDSLLLDSIDLHERGHDVSGSAPYSPDGYRPTITEEVMLNDGHVPGGNNDDHNYNNNIHLDNHQNIEIVESDRELDEVENDVIVVVRGSTVDGMGSHNNDMHGDGIGDDDDIVNDINDLEAEPLANGGVSGGRTIGTDVGEMLLSQPGSTVLISDDEQLDEMEEEFEIVDHDENITAGVDQ